MELPIHRANKSNVIDINNELDSARRREVQRKLAGFAAVSLSTLVVGGLGINYLTGDRLGNIPHLPDSYTDLAKKSAEQPYNPAKDTLVIGNVKFSPKYNTASESVLYNPRVVKYEKENPDEASAIISSANALPEAESYALVARDIDHDGDSDTVAVVQDK